MKTVTIHVFDKNSSTNISRTFRIDGRTKENLESEVEEFFAEITFSLWYCDVECFDELTEEEKSILTELDLIDA